MRAKALNSDDPVPDPKVQDRATNATSASARRRRMDRKHYGWWAVLILAPFFLRESAFEIPLPDDVLFFGRFAVMALMAAIVILWGGWRLRLGVGVMLAATLPSLFHDEIGKDSVMRWGAWVMVVIAVGPLLASQRASRFRQVVWEYMRWIFIGICVASLLVSVLGISLSGRGLFYGVMSHAMLLAPIAGLATIDCLFRYMCQPRLRWLLLLSAAMAAMLLCGSRSAILGCGSGCLWMLLSVRGLQRRQTVLALAILIGVFALIDSGFFSSGNQDKFGTSPQINERVLTEELWMKGNTDTRTWLWNARIREFKESPITGIGYALTLYGRVSQKKVQIEPGSSYLAILSMTGLFGAVGWLALFADLSSTYLRAAPSMPRIDRLALGGVAIFFAIHLAFEGYIYACGSLVGLIFYAWLGMAWDVLERNRLQRVVEPDSLAVRPEEPA